VYLVLLGFLTFFVRCFYEAVRQTCGISFSCGSWVYLLLVPAAAMRLWSEERRSGTLELLLTLPVTLTQAILGKYLAALVFLGLALFLTFPVVATAAYLGNPDMGVVWGGYLGAFLLAGTYLSVGVATSALTRNQVISFVLSLVIGLFLLLAGYPPVTDLLVRWAPVWLVDGVAALSFMPHYESIQRGVLDIRDIVYYVSVIGVMLFGAHLILESRKSA
jgi:ABC-2 type transport system permease protein